MSSSPKFHWKVFVSFYVVFSFLALGGVGAIVLYVAPPGRIANWSVWQLLLLSKAQWQAVHTTRRAPVPRGGRASTSTSTGRCSSRT